jgi:hypothetical protein
LSSQPHVNEGAHFGAPLNVCLDWKATLDAGRALGEVDNGPEAFEVEAAFLKRYLEPAEAS